jgi:hypothetical protein
MLITKGETAMKILEIRENKGFFRRSAKDAWKEIDAIDKDDLMALLDAFLGAEVEMDPPDDTKLQNQAQQIIYKSIFDKLNSLQKNKSKFKDESDRKYLKEIQRYSDGAASGGAVLLT